MEDAVSNQIGFLVLVASSAPLLLGAATWAAVKYFVIARRYRDIIDVDRETEQKRKQLELVAANYLSKRNVYGSLLEAIRGFEETIDAADYGLYSPHYDFDTAEDYKAELDSIRDDQKRMIREKSAAHCGTKWEVHGSKQKGTTMTNRQIRLMLRAFNGECDATIQMVRWNNVEKMEDRLDRIHDAINKLGETQDVSIATDYYGLKLAELRLAHEYVEKRQEEKEEQRAIREQMREEERVQKEIRAAQKEAQEEERRYQNALDRARKELAGQSEETASAMRGEIDRLQMLVVEAHDKKVRATSRAQMTKAGHVYVISNVGSFGEGTYKIGMTRRLDPQDRVKELGDASVPFPFDVHALIYSENAPELEKALHRAFGDRRRNRVNTRKEFFDIGLDAIEAEVKKHRGQIQFTKRAVAREFRETVSMRADEALGSAVGGFGEDSFPLEI